MPRTYYFKILIAIMLWAIMIDSSNAQKDLRDGYIIDNDFDTLYGYIDFRGDISNSQECIFYENLGPKPCKYLPGEIIAYRFTNGRYYVGRELKTGSTSRLVFLEYLVNGITNLFFIRDSDGDHYFIEKGNQLLELTNSKVIINNKDGQFQVDNNKYIGMLNYIYGDNEEMLPLIRKTKFERSSLSKLSVDYHNMVCTDRQCIVYLKDTKEFRLKVGPAVSVEWEYEDYKNYLSPYKFETTPHIFIGINTKIWFLTLNEKISLSFNTLLGHVYGTGSYTETFIGGSNNYIINYKRNIFKSGINVMIDFPGKKIKPYLGLGPGVDFPFNQSSEMTKYNYDEEGNLKDLMEYKDIIKQKYSVKIQTGGGIIIKVRDNELSLGATLGAGIGFYISGTENSTTEHYVWNENARLLTFGFNCSFIF